MIARERVSMKIKKRDEEKRDRMIDSVIKRMRWENREGWERERVLLLVGIVFRGKERGHVRLG